jgi:hypothetical protein
VSGTILEPPPIAVRAENAVYGPIVAPTYPARPVNGGAFNYGSIRGGWKYEPKYNGWRALVHTPTGAMFNRRGERLSIEREFAEALFRFDEFPEWLDCEALDRRHGIGRGALIVLDLLDVPNTRSGQRPILIDYFDRRSWLTARFNTLPIDSRPEPGKVYCAPSYFGEQAVEIYDELQAINARWGVPFYEGLVGKKESSLYPIQLRSPDQEFPFWQKHRWAF